MCLLSYISELGDDDLRAVATALDEYRWPWFLPESLKPLWWYGENGMADEYLEHRVHGFATVILDFVEDKLAKLDKKSEIK